MAGDVSTQGATVGAKATSGASRQRRVSEKLAPRAVLVIPVDKIDIPSDRLRSLKEPQAKAIGAAIIADRQYDPISVAQLPGSDRFTLVDGLHRLAGLRLHGADNIEARIVPADRAGRRRQEIASAWARADEDVFDRAAIIAELCASASDEDAFQCIGTALRWDLAAAEVLGVKKSTIRNYVALNERFDDAAKKLLRQREMAGLLVPLLRLAALPPEELATVMGWIEQGAVASIAEAMDLLLPTKPPSHVAEKAARSLIKKMADWDVVDRKRLISKLLEAFDRNGNPRADGDE
jgi:ParB-like chromosome segregation protein Spo0J